MRYNILWIDDDYKIQKDFISFAEQLGLDITAVESHEEGMLELENRKNFYQAVILDAKVKKGIILTLEEKESLEFEGVKIEVMPVWKWILGSKT